MGFDWRSIASVSTCLIAVASALADSRGAPEGVAMVDGLAIRRQAGDVQGFGGVDVAKPGHDPLIEQRRLERRLLALAGLRQDSRVELRRQRLGTERAQHGMRRQRAR